MEELLKKAKALGILNAESLTQKQLEKQIKEFEKERLQLFAEVQELSADVFDLDNYTNAEIKTAIDELKQQLETTTDDQKKKNLFFEKFGIDFDASSVEDFLHAIEKHNPELTVKPAVDLNAGKTSETFEVYGKKYQFSKNAPATFRFANQLKTQKEWIKDTDSLELMVAGNLSYLKKV